MASLDLQTLIGMAKEDAFALLKLSGTDYRVVAEDGEYYILTSDWCPDRVNLVLNDGKITKFNMG